MDAFFTSVEQRDFPEYRGKPVIVGGPPESRGVVAAASYEVRRFGVHSAMPSARARKLCPDAIFIRPRFEVYRDCSQQIQAIFQRFSGRIEPLSLDEAFLDVSDSELFQGSATLIAREIKRLVKEEVGLTASAGVSYCKFLAKVASDLDKPDGLSVIRPEQAEQFLAGLPVRKFFGIGKATEAKMHALGIFTGAELRQWSKPQLQQHFGKSGRFYFDIVRGIDNRPVNNSRVRKSIGKETTFARDMTDPREMWQVLEQLAEKVGALLEAKELSALSLTLKVKYADFQQITRSLTLGESRPIADKDEMLERLPELIAKTDMQRRPVRLLGISLSNFHSREPVGTSEQMDLF